VLFLYVPDDMYWEFLFALWGLDVHFPFLSVPKYMYLKLAPLPGDVSANPFVFALTFFQMTLP
jgi:hypothetical protein